MQSVSELQGNEAVQRVNFPLVYAGFPFIFFGFGFFLALGVKGFGGVLSILARTASREFGSPDLLMAII